MADNLKMTFDVGDLDNSSSSIESLAKALNNLERAADKAAPALSRLENGLMQLKTTARSASDAETNVSKLVASLEKLSQVKMPTNSQIGRFNQFTEAMKNMGLVSTHVSQSGGDLGTFATNVDRVSNSLKSLSEFKLTKSNVDNINNLINSLGGVKGDVSGQLRSIADGLKAFSEISLPRGLGTFGESINQMVQGLQNMPEGFDSNLAKLAKSLKDNLGNLPKSELGSYINPLSKLGKSIQGVANINTAELNSALQTVKELILQMEKLGITSEKNMHNLNLGSNRGANSYIKPSQESVRSQKPITQMDFDQGIVRFVGGLAGAYKAITNIVGESNRYVENMNLFTVSMGEYAQKAAEYGQKVQDALGVDASDWMRNQGMFMQIFTAFGTARSEAQEYSKILTQISYDLSSFYNISPEEAFNKTSAAVAGQVQPLRRLGIAVDVYTLQEVAMRHGINLSVRAMNNAEKAQLRLMAIYEQSKNALGDFSRTIMTPANAIRVLDSQVNRLKRSIGNALIPMLMQVIPVVQAIVEVLTFLFNALAKLFGFELPKIDYSGVGAGIGGLGDEFEDVGNNIDGATAKAKEFKAFLAGFDEMNVIPEPPESGGGGGAGGAGAGLGSRFKLDIPDYDFLGGANSKALKKAQDFIKLLQDFWDMLGPVQETVKVIAKWLGKWLVIQGIIDILFRILGLGPKVTALFKSIGSIAISQVENFRASYDAAYGYVRGTLTRAQAFFKMLGGWIVGTLGTFVGLKWLDSAFNFIDPLMKFFGLDVGKTPFMITLALAVTTIVSMVGYVKGVLDAQKDEYFASLMGDLHLTDEQIKRLVDRYVNTPIALKISLAYDAIEEANKKIEGVRESLANIRVEKLLLEVGVGDSSKLMSELDSAIKNAQDYLEAETKAITLSVDLFFGGDGSDISNIVESQTGTTRGFQKELNPLKKQLLELFDNAELTEEEKNAEALKIAKQIEDVMRRVEAYQREIQTRADMLVIKKKYGLDMEFDGDYNNIDWDSYKAAMGEVQAKIEENREKLIADYSKEKIIIDIEFEKGNIDETEYKRQLEELEQKYEKLEFETTVEPIFEMKGDFAQKIQNDVDEAFSSIEIRDYPNISLKDITNSLYVEAKDGLRPIAKEVGVSATAISNAMKEYFETTYKTVIEGTFQPTLESVRKQGKSLSDAQRQAFEEAARTGVVAGDKWSSDLLVAADFTKKPGFNDFIRRVRDEFGSNIPQGIADGITANLNLIATSTGELYQNLNGQLIKIDRDVIPVLESMGYNINDRIAKSTIGNVQLVETAMNSLGSSAMATLRQVFLENGEISRTARAAMEELARGIDLPDDQLSTQAVLIRNKLRSIFGDGWEAVLRDSNYFLSRLTNSLNSFSGQMSFRVTYQEAVAKERVMSGRTGGSAYGRGGASLGRGMWFDTGANQAFGITPIMHRTTDLGIKNVDMFAGGGMPKAGQLFIAREYGPELVGTIGGQNAVANNAQIIEGISGGVYEATLTALGKFAAGVGRMIAKAQNQNYVYNRDNQDTEEDKYNGYVTRADFDYGLNQLAKVLVDGMERTSGRKIVVDGRELARITTQNNRRISQMED